MDKTFFSLYNIFDTDQNLTGINSNELIIGSTGTGKTKSIIEPKLIYAEKDNYVISASKKNFVETYSKIFKRKGYNVKVLNLSDPLGSLIGFDPLTYLHNENDYLWFSKIICEPKDNYSYISDKYWTDAATILLAGEIDYIKTINHNATLYDLFNFHHHLEIKEQGSRLRTNIDENLRDFKPASLTVRGFKQLINNAPKTANCVLSTLNSILDGTFTKHLAGLSTYKNVFNIFDLTKKKQVLFLLSDPVNKISVTYTNILYSIFFKFLFKIANKFHNTLPIPIRFICDDAAHSAKIPELEQYITIFRENNISITLVLQSETQLNSLYGPDAANIIIDNCDTYAYLGGNDLISKQNLSLRANLPLEELVNFPLESILILRRGREPVIDKRFPILTDELYLEYNSRPKVK